MQNGDISNDLPKRIIVTSDVVIQTEVSIKKKYKFLPLVEKTTNYRRDLLSFLYLVTTNRGVTLELGSFDYDQEELSNIMLNLDEMGTNPFRYCTAYGSVGNLVKELPYRPEVFGVVDIDSRLLRYGKWGLGFNEL
jgi:hypothetical protein